MYPALVNCTTVIYFSEWPHEALIDVAYHFLRNFNFGLENNGTVKIFLISFNFI
jgi:dynein heavy chain